MAGMAGKTGTITNDPSTAVSRVFVGNLNTFAMNKNEIEAIFLCYGYVTGISMHKGYAFVQYAHPGEARRAVAMEDGKVYAGQQIDCNIASEPKKKSTLKKGPIPMGMSGPRPTAGSVRTHQPPVKKMRQDVNPIVKPGMKRTLVTLSGDAIKTEITSSPAVTTAEASKDILICGKCKTSFSSLSSLTQHKRTPCLLRFSCKCQKTPPAESREPIELSCATCDAEFSSAWDLCQHCQKQHGTVIYKVEGEDAEGENIQTVENLQVVTIVENDEVNGDKS
ncbi:hypothetical protein ScPMuIL_001735 [Solemya velum]